MGRTVDRILSEIDLIEYMRNCGYTPYPLGNGSYYGLKEHSSVRIYPDTNTYFHPGDSNGDPRRLNVINFAEWYYKIDNKEAIKLLAKELNGSPSYVKSKVQRDTPKIEKKPFALPQKNAGQYKHVYAYLLKTRCINRNVINDMIRRDFLYEDIRGNATFVGFNNNNEACFCFQRGCSDKIPDGQKRAFTRVVENSNFDFAWNVCNNSNKLFVTEAAIDSLSVMTMFELHNMNPNNYDYVATCGSSIRPMINYVKNHPDIKTIYLGYDNDFKGNQYRQRSIESLKEIGYKGKIIDKKPHTKDWNEDLKQLNQNPIVQNKTINSQNTIERMMHI